KPVVYSLNLEGGRKYVGKTNNFQARMNQHFSGNGAKWTQQNKPVSINHTQVCRSNETAKAAESIVYRNMSKYHGKDNVRGAGHTKTT
ncbi:unnamed protein product, partial [Ectocarpus sp. 12 AP-2014]